MMEGRNNSVVIILTTTELYHIAAVFETEKEHFHVPFCVWRRTTGSIISEPLPHLRFKCFNNVLSHYHPTIDHIFISPYVVWINRIFFIVMPNNH